MLVAIGVVIAAGFAAWLACLGARGKGEARFPGYGWWGLGAIVGLEILLALRTPGVTTFFTALIWPAYIVAVDAAVYRLRGDSLLHRPMAFIAMALLSIPAWLIFEVYNLRLANWDYVGVPRQFWVFALGAGVAFATILPGIFETAELFEAAWTKAIRWPAWRWAWPMRLVALGAALLLIPLLVPTHWAAYLFALVWVGFIALLDPLHRRWGWPSLLSDLEQGRPGWLLALLLSGAACGFFWEFWNFWAQSRWVYIFPIFHRYRIFAMPVPGFVGFPPFAVECFTLYVFLSQSLLPPRLRYGFLHQTRGARRLHRGQSPAPSRRRLGDPRSRREMAAKFRRAAPPPASDEARPRPAGALGVSSRSSVSGSLGAAERGPAPVNERSGCPGVARTGPAINMLG